MIEAQQKVIDAEHERPPMPASADKAITIFQHMMRSLDRVANDTMHLCKL